MNTLIAQPNKQIVFTPEDLFNEFYSNLGLFSYNDLFAILDKEINPLARVLVRAALKAKENDKPFLLSLEKAKKRVAQIENTKRKNFVRRSFKKWGLFAIDEIKKSYPAYTSEMLPTDLNYKSKKKGKKFKFKLDFRARQLDKYQHQYELACKTIDKDSKEFNKLCERIAALTAANKKRLPIRLTVKIQKETYVYHFHWNTYEKDIKIFHQKANEKGMTHRMLHEFRGIPFDESDSFTL